MRLIQLLLAFALLTVTLFAQSSEPRLAGTWTIDDDYVRTRGDQTWIIWVSESEVRVEKIFHSNDGHQIMALRPDKSGQTNVVGVARSLDSKSYWKDKKLIREYSYKVGDRGTHGMFGPEYSDARVTEMYYLSKDGNKLIFRRDDDSISPNRNTPVKMGRAFEDKIVFRRKS